MEGRAGVEIEERSFVASLHWMTAKWGLGDDEAMIVTAKEC